jgi:hypothetical protein
MSSERRYISLGTFLTALGIILVLWGTLYSYSFTRIATVEDRQATQDISNSDIKAQLSQIQTDLQWIKTTLIQEYKK